MKKVLVLKDNNNEHPFDLKTIGAFTKIYKDALGEDYIVIGLPNRLSLQEITQDIDGFNVYVKELQDIQSTLDKLDLSLDKIKEVTN